MFRALRDLRQGLCWGGKGQAASIPTLLAARAEGSGLPDKGEERLEPEILEVQFL